MSSCSWSAVQALRKCLASTGANSQILSGELSKQAATQSDTGLMFSRIVFMGKDAGTDSMFLITVSCASLTFNVSSGDKSITVDR